MSLYEYTMDRAKSALKMKISEYEMLNKTLIEMIEKGSSDIVIDTLKHDIDETLDTINELREWIEKETDKEDSKVEYSFYDKIEKPKLAKSVKLASFGKSSDGRRFSYDTINKSVEKMNEDLKKDKVVGELNHPNLYDAVKKEPEKLNYENLYNTISNAKPKYDNTKNEDTTLKFLNTETNGKYLNDTITNSNRFLVRFNGALNIDEWLVKSVDFSTDNRKELVITIQDHLAEKDGKKYPIISEIRDKANPYSLPFTLAIDYLERTGCVLYTERYHGCMINDIIKSSLTYETGGFNAIQFTVTFSDITYETSH